MKARYLIFRGKCGLDEESGKFHFRVKKKKFSIEHYLGGSVCVWQYRKEVGEGRPQTNRVGVKAGV